ncbi:MAG: 4'-phosphopantetheinyl transferase superfamily protein, partial [Verrucomicrobia bacterium]|nr:4'-phosphopantetheinyl transferase superfamily protein [Verrucomicrobiota bacterium]
MSECARRYEMSAHLQPLGSPHEGVELWFGDTAAISPDDVLELAALTSAPEQRRARRFFAERDRRCFLVARAWLRILLGAAIGEKPNRLVFEFGAHGKPMIAGGERRLQFNLSHSGAHVLFGVTRDCAIGVDLESMARAQTANLENIAARVFSPRELARWQAFDDPICRRAAFLRAWTRKEAYLKATGEGLSTDLRFIEVLASDEQAGWSGVVRNATLYDIAAPAGFAAALAVLDRAAPHHSSEPAAAAQLLPWRCSQAKIVAH